MPDPVTPTRVDLGDDQWIEITQRPSHGRMNTWYQAVQRNMADSSAYLDLVQVTILSFGLAWNVQGEDGHELPFDAAGVSAAPFDKTMAAFRATQSVAEAVRASLDPNGSGRT